MTKHCSACAFIFFILLAALTSPSAVAQAQGDKNLCENFSRIGFQNAQQRDQGKSQEQIIAYNSRYIADVMNRTNTFQDYLTLQVKKLYTEDYQSLSPEQVKSKLYEDCIVIFK